jgi:hypothetical protein
MLCRGLEADAPELYATYLESFFFFGGFGGGLTLSTSAITSLNGKGMCGIGFELVIFFSSGFIELLYFFLRHNTTL